MCVAPAPQMCVVSKAFSWNRGSSRQEKDEAPMASNFYDSLVLQHQPFLFLKRPS